MELGLVLVAGVALIVVFSILAKRLGVAAPVVLLLVGVGISYIPGVPEIEIPHEIILLGVLPPILYSAALQVPVIDFRRNFSSISSLSVLLVIASAFVTGFVLHLLLPELPFAAALALGAVISPPDAVAAISIGRRLGLPPRLLTVLEGEGLVNDATALVLLRSAIAATAGGLATVWEGVVDFAYAAAVAVIIGLIVGFVTVWLRSRISDSVKDTTIALLAPFLAFIPAEELGASGVLAVVVAGLYVGHTTPRHVDAQSRMAERVTWRSVQFVLEHAVFLVMGLEMHALINDIAPGELTAGSAILIGLLLTLVLVVIRFAWVNPMVFLLQRAAERQEVRLAHWKESFTQRRADAADDPRLQRRLERVRTLYLRRMFDLEHTRSDGLDWRGGIVISWSGMRGVVTLAAAQSLPAETPFRAQLILIAFTVAVVTLVAQGTTLPLLIRLLGVEGIDPQEDRRRLASLLEELSDEGLKALEHPEQILAGEEVDPAVLNRVRSETLTRIDALWERAESPAIGGPAPHRQYRALRNAVVAREYEALLEARSLGKYPSRILHEALRMLELEETRLQPRQGDH